MDKIYFILHKPGEPGTNKTQHEKHLVITFPNRLVFFNSWNTLVVTCKNSFQDKCSDLTVFLNSKVKSLKLAVDRDTLFHCFEMIHSENQLNEKLMIPRMSTQHLLNELYICENFEGKLFQCVVFKELIGPIELDNLSKIVVNCDELNTLESHLKVRNWMQKNQLSVKIALDFNAFDLRAQHIRCTKILERTCQHIVDCYVQKIQPFKDSLQPLNCRIAFNESASLTKVHLVPITGIDLETTESEKTTKEGPARPLSFQFSFEFFANDPYQFDFSLYQQSFFRPFLLSYKAISHLTDIPLQKTLQETWVKVIANFLSKPRLSNTYSSEHIKLYISELLSTFIFDSFSNPQGSFFSPKICDIFLDILNSLELSVSVHVLNDLLLDQIFLFELSSYLQEMNHFFSKLSAWILKYKKIRELINWQNLLDNFIFFLAISDFADEASDNHPHVQLAKQLATLILLFFPFCNSINESLLIFHTDLSLSSHFFPISDIIEIQNPSTSKDRSIKWTERHSFHAKTILEKLGTNRPKTNPIRMDVTLLIYQLSSPLLIKAPTKTALLLDILFLILEHHSCLLNSKQTPQSLFLPTFLSLIYDFKNNSSEIIIRSMALLLKSNFSFKDIPACFFNLKKFQPKSSVLMPNQNLLSLLDDPNYIIQQSSPLLEYMLFLIFDNYSLTGFFDHERLSISESTIFYSFFSITKFLEAPALEKALQIFSIMLKHLTKMECFTHFNSPSILISILDMFYKFFPSFRDEDDLKIKAFRYLKEQESSSVSRIELAKSSDLHELLLYFEVHSSNWHDFLANGTPKNAVFDLSFRVLRLMNQITLNEMNDPLSLCHSALLSSLYLRKLRSWPLYISISSLYFEQFEEYALETKSCETLNFVVLCFQFILEPLDLSFYQTPKTLMPIWLQSLLLVRRWFSIFERALFQHFTVNDIDMLLKKNRFKFLYSDKRFPLSTEKLFGLSEFCFLHLVSLDSFQNFPSRHQNKKSKKMDAQGPFIETIFLFSRCLYKIIKKSNLFIKMIKGSILNENEETRLEVDRHILVSLGILSKQVQLVLMLSRHSAVKKKSVRFKETLEKIIVSLTQLLQQTLNLVGIHIFQ